MGDVILEFAQQKVSQPSDLQRVVERSSIGSSQRMKVIRDGKTKLLTVAIEELPNDLTVADFQHSESTELGDLGLSVGELTPQTVSQLGLSSDEGVLITAVENNSFAASAGLEAGDVILKVGRTNIDSVATLKDVMKELKSVDGLVLTIRNRQGSRIIYLGK